MTDVNIDQINVSFEPNEADYESICSNLYQYNVRTTNGLLKPKDINIFLRDDLGKAVGGLFCETWLQGLYLEKMGYEIFGINDEYPDGIKQYFLKKKLN